MADYFDREAELDESDEGSIGGEAGASKRKSNGKDSRRSRADQMDLDSSEEENTEDEAEGLAKVSIKILAYAAGWFMTDMGLDAF